MAGDLAAILKDAGMADSLVQKLEDHQIDKELFFVMNVQFMRDVINLPPLEIMQIKTFQSKKLLSSENISEGCTPQGSTSSTGSQKQLNHPNISLNLPRNSSPEPNEQKSSSSSSKSKSDQTRSSPHQKKSGSSSGSSKSNSDRTKDSSHQKKSGTSSSSSKSKSDQTRSSSQSKKSSSSSSDSKKSKSDRSRSPSSSSNTKSSSDRPLKSSHSRSLESPSGSSRSSFIKPSSSSSVKSSSHSKSSSDKAQHSSHRETSGSSSSKSKSGLNNTRTSIEDEGGDERRDDNLFSDGDGDSDKENSTTLVTEEDINAAVKEFKADPKPSFASLKGSLPEFDVVSILHKEMKTAQSRYKANFVELLQKRHLDRTKRLCIIRKLTRYLYHEHASSPSDVTPSMKEGMAKSFCIVFPQFANTDDQKQPWSPVFSPTGPAGYIANASRAFMKQNPKRPVKARKRKSAESTPCEMDDDDIQALGLVNCGRDERNEILDGMARCFQAREAERARQEPITFFMKKYCQFDKYGGEVLSEEFKRLRPEAEDMCKVFLKFLPKILSLNLRREVDLPIDDDGVKALVILSQHLPHDIPRRQEKSNQSWAELKDIIVVLKPSVNIQEYVESRIEKAKAPIQPYLIFVRGQLDRNKITRIFIVLDAQTCAVDTVSSIKGVDWLFQCYFIFNVNYPLGWRNTFHFLQTCFYKIMEHQGRKKDKVNSSEFELWQKLR